MGGITMSNISLIDGHIDNAEHCVSCGAVIPEGRQVCIICGLKTNYKQSTTDVVKVIRLQAIKEFVERLKETITNAINTYYNSNGGGYYLAEDVIEDIDDLVKEMTE
jgi:predicted nucleic acid-binding Zn ribbon protein